MKVLFSFSMSDVCTFISTICGELKKSDCRFGCVVGRNFSESRWPQTDMLHPRCYDADTN